MEETRIEFHSAGEVSHRRGERLVRDLPLPGPAACTKLLNRNVNCFFGRNETSAKTSITTTLATTFPTFTPTERRRWRLTPTWRRRRSVRSERKDLPVRAIHPAAAQELVKSPSTCWLPSTPHSRQVKICSYHILLVINIFWILWIIWPLNDLICFFYIKKIMVCPFEYWQLLFVWLIYYHLYWTFCNDLTIFLIWFGQSG